MSKRSDSLYVRDIKEAIDAIFSYTRDSTLDDFQLDRMRYSAVIREFELIGEAVSNLSDNVKENYPHIAWQDIKDFRNLLIHEYFGVDLEIVWNIVRSDLPSLYEAIKRIDKETTIDDEQ
jgi:uncharacterized protein with HEPN domain